MAKIINRERLRAKLRAMPTEIRKDIKDALERGAQEIVDLQYHLAPVRTGHLRASIDWTWGDVPKGAVFSSKSFQSGDPERLLISIYAGNPLAYYVRWVEFGTSKGAVAQPFFFPGYRASRKKVLSRVTAATNKALKRVANMGG